MRYFLWMICGCFCCLACHQTPVTPCPFTGDSGYVMRQTALPWLLAQHRDTASFGKDTIGKYYKRAGDAGYIFFVARKDSLHYTIRHVGSTDKGGNIRKWENYRGWKPSYGPTHAGDALNKVNGFYTLTAFNVESVGAMTTSLYVFKDVQPDSLLSPVLIEYHAGEYDGPGGSGVADIGQMEISNDEKMTLHFDENNWDFLRVNDTVEKKINIRHRKFEVHFAFRSGNWVLTGGDTSSYKSLL